jgi:hypothetical protein
VATSTELTTVTCPSCGRERDVSARALTDDDLCELATIIFNRPGSVRRIRAERERLLRRVGMAA